MNEVYCLWLSPWMLIWSAEVEALELLDTLEQLILQILEVGSIG